MSSKINIHLEYKTRDGQKVRLHEICNDVIWGAIFLTGFNDWIHHTWDIYGKYKPKKPEPHHLDLIGNNGETK